MEVSQCEVELVRRPTVQVSEGMKQPHEDITEAFESLGQLNYAVAKVSVESGRYLSGEDWPTEYQLNQVAYRVLQKDNESEAWRER